MPAADAAPGAPSGREPIIDHLGRGGEPLPQERPGAVPGAAVEAPPATSAPAASLVCPPADPAAARRRALKEAPFHGLLRLPEVETSPHALSGHRTNDELEMPLESAWVRVVLCRADALNKGDSFAGAARIRVEIDRCGVVVSAQVNDTNPPAGTFLACIAEAYTDVAFPAIDEDHRDVLRLEHVFPAAPVKRP